jgi:hypothetical protein
MLVNRRSIHDGSNTTPQPSLRREDRAVPCTVAQKVDEAEQHADQGTPLHASERHRCSQGPYSQGFIGDDLLSNPRKPTKTWLRESIQDVYGESRAESIGRTAEASDDASLGTVADLCPWLPSIHANVHELTVCVAPTMLDVQIRSNRSSKRACEYE